MNKLDPTVLFKRLADDVPKELHKHLFVTGSLAAAYHFKTKLQGQAINTKDADLVVHPAGHVMSCQAMANRLLELGWRRTNDCYPMQSAEPATDLRAIRLFPPQSDDYFVEFLNIPSVDQQEGKKWIPLQLNDGYYGLPSFRFLGIAAKNRLHSDAGLEYASPAMMALANLLSHPAVGTQRIEAGYVQGILRSAKDLGRVIALAHLVGRDESVKWSSLWKDAIHDCFPKQEKELTATLGDGLSEAIADDAVMEDMRKTTDIGLLNGMDVSPDQLRAVGKRLLADVIAPLRKLISGT